MKTVQNLLIFILLLCIHQLQAQNNALDFNGSSNYISVPAKASYDLTTGTIECLVKPSSFGSGLTILGVRGAGGTRYSIHLRQNSVNMWNGTTSAQLSYAFTLGVWYHVAFVCIGPTETKCYINGSLIGSVGYGFGYATGQPLYIGSVIESGTPQQLFSGAIDEVRIWNTIRTPEEINENKDVSLVGSETGLMALFTFNQGTAGGTNTSETTLLEKSSSHNNGTLNNFSLTGANSNYIASPLSIPASGASPWLMGGNGGTASSSNFMGTTDFRRLIFKTNNIERMTILPNGNIGIGTTSPSSSLTIKQQTDGIGMQLQAPDGEFSNNYLKFGTNPTFPFISSMWSNARLDISAGEQLFLFGSTIYLSGNTVVTRTGDPSSLATAKSSRTMPFEANVWNGTTGVLTYAGMQNIASTTTNLAHRLAFKVASHNPDLNDGTEAFSVLSSGNVGIGITDPKVKLAVNGEIKSTKLTVTATPWADFIFDKNYKLTSLPDVEKFILKFKHLPQVPTAAEVSIEGIDVGTQQALLLQKVEELTLYLIEQNKVNAQQQRDINALKKALKKNNK